jgi:arginine deiminase
MSNTTITNTTKPATNQSNEPTKQQIYVGSEIGTLQRVITHSPDGGIGKVVPTKAQDWLYEDIVDLNEMQKEYDVFKQILLAFLDETTLKNWFEKEMEFERNTFSEKAKRASFKKPDHVDFLDSDKVIEIQRLIAKILENERVRDQLVASICAVERCDFSTQQMLADKNYMTATDLAKTLITGFVRMPNGVEHQIFPPLPNFIFTRDIGIIINDNLLLSKTAKQARLRESILTKYIAYYLLYKENPEKVIEIAEDDEFFLCEDNEKESKIVTIEGGDLMMISESHLLIGYSERTSANAIDKIIKRLFNLKKTNADEPLLKKISVIVIPKWRGTMHIDTIFTHVDRGTWVLHSPMSLEGQPQYNTEINYINDLTGKSKLKPEEITGVSIVQFMNEVDSSTNRYKVHYNFRGFEDLMRSISKEDFGFVGDVNFVYSGNAEYPYDEREQWTDACNVVAVREGIVLGYDRNHKTNEAFQKYGFGIMNASEIIKELRDAYFMNRNSDLTQVLHSIVPKKCLILIPSSELSRARGGTHCMTMPILREKI